MNYGALKSIPKETNINGQFHQLSYIRPDEAALLKSMGGAGTAGPGGVPQYGFAEWANNNLGTSFDTSSSTDSSSSSSSSSDDDKGYFEKAWDYGKDLVTEIVTLGTYDTDTFNSTEPSNSYVTDAGTAVVNFVKDTATEITTGGDAVTGTYNPEVFYDAFGDSYSTQAEA